MDKYERMEIYWNVANVAYGFVYRWTDTKRGRYYIGSHWGRFNDGYVCSSTTMRNARMYRPDTFTRRILTVVTTNRLDLLAKEQAYLDKMPRKDFGALAYNVSTKVHKPWWAKGQKVKQAVRDKQKARWQNPERKERASMLAKARTYSPETRAKMAAAAKKRWTPEARAQHSENLQGRVPWNLGMKGQQMAWNLGLPGPSPSKATRVKLSKALKGRPRTPEVRAQLSEAAKLKWKSPEYRQQVSEYRAAARREGKLKLTLRQADKIRKMYATKKHTMQNLADAFGVSLSYIHNIIRDARWDICP